MLPPLFKVYDGDLWAGINPAATMGMEIDCHGGADPPAAEHPTPFVPFNMLSLRD